MLIFLLLKFLDEKLHGSKKYFRMDSNLGFLNVGINGIFGQIILFCRPFTLLYVVGWLTGSLVSTQS